MLPPDAGPYLFWLCGYFDGLTSSLMPARHGASVQAAVGSIATSPAAARALDEEALQPHAYAKTATVPFIGKLLSRRHSQRFPKSPFGARFRIRDRAAVGRDAAQPADLEDTVGWKVANPLLQDELRRIGEFGAHGLRIAGITVHLEQHLLDTPTLPPPGLPVHGGFVRVGALALEVDVVDQRIKILGGANDARELDDDMFALRAVGRRLEDLLHRTLRPRHHELRLLGHGVEQKLPQLFDLRRVGVLPELGPACPRVGRNLCLVQPGGQMHVL